MFLLGLASLGATPRPLSRLWRWSGLGFPSGDYILGDICGTRRSSAAIDSRVRAFVDGDFGNVLIGSELLVQESRGETMHRSVHGEKSGRGRRLTLVYVLPASPGGLEGEADRAQCEVAQRHVWQSRIHRP